MELPSPTIMPPRTPAQARVTDYDPAYHTLRFEMLAVLSRIFQPPSSLCKACKRGLINKVHQTYTTLLTEPLFLPPDAPGSRISHARFNPGTTFTEIRTTANPNPVIINDAVATLHFHDPLARETILTRLFEALYTPHDDTLNQIQTQIWHCFAGYYTVMDAVHGRSITEFARTHMQLLTNLTGGRARGDGREYACRAASDPGSAYDCFGGPVVGEYPFGGDAEKKTACVLDAVQNHMDEEVWEVVREALDEDMKGEPWPAGLDQEKDWLVVLGVVERTEMFKARIRALKAGEEYRFVAERHEKEAEDWRAGQGARRAAELAGRESEVDGIEMSLVMLDGMKTAFLKQNWEEPDDVIEYGEE